MRHVFHDQIGEEKWKDNYCYRRRVTASFFAPSCPSITFAHCDHLFKKPLPENAPFAKTMAATYEFKLLSTGG